MNTGDLSSVVFPEREEAEWRVLRMQKKLHRWATENPDRRFDDLANLVYDPAFLVVAWHRVRGTREHEQPASMGSARAVSAGRRWICWPGSVRT